MELLFLVSALSTLTWVFWPSGHSGTLEPSGKKHALPENIPTSSSGMSARNSPGLTSSSGMSVQARAIGVSPRSVSAIISRRLTRACPMLVRNAARPFLGESSSRVTVRTSPLHLRRMSCGLGVCVIWSSSPWFVPMRPMCAASI